MKRKPTWVKKGEKYAKVAKEASAASLKKIASQVETLAGELDEHYKVSERSNELIKRAENKLRKIDDGYAISQKAKTGLKTMGQTAHDIKEHAEKAGITENAVRAGKALKDLVFDPVVKLAEETGLSEQIGKISEATVEQYGKTRALIKPYFAPETPSELLQNTKRELIYINACILQISQGEAEQLANRLGKAIASKIAGAASVGTLLGMIGTFGTASTGTAIAGLHGAAAANATLYWVGSLLGGGMATGAVLTGGVALVVAYSVYTLVSSKARRFEDLGDTERSIVEATGFLIAAISDVLGDPKKSLSANEADLLLQNTLKPLYKSLIENSDDICESLDRKHKILFRQHAIVDFQKSVLGGFKFFIQEENVARRRYPEFVIAGVIYALLTQSGVDDSRESQLALKAIRRVKTAWNDATESQLSADLARYEPEQLQGIARDAKGIYHEILFVDDYNKSHSGTYAELFGATNHPGADVQIRSSDTNEVLNELQLKATSNADLVREHLERYPDIDVLATEEIARKSGLAHSSGFSNTSITEDMDQTLDDVVDNTISDRAEEAAELAGLVAAGREAIRVLRGHQSMSEAGINVVKAATVTATSTALVAYLFS